MTEHLELLRTLCQTPGPTGFEAAVQDVVRRRLAPLGEAVGDPLGNVWLGVGPENGPLVAIAAHADQIGLIVTHVDERGYVFVERIGGLAPLLVPGRHFVIHGRKGDVHAVGGRKPSHIIPLDERRTAPELHEQFLDVGAGGRDDTARARRRRRLRSRSRPTSWSSRPAWSRRRRWTTVPGCTP